MNALMIHDPSTRPVTTGEPEVTAMLLHEALARSRQREAEEAARQYRLVRAALAARRRPTWLGVLVAPLRRAARRRAAARRAACSS